MKNEIENLLQIKEKTELFTNSLVHIFIPWGFAISLVSLLPHDLPSIYKLILTFIMYIFVIISSLKLKEYYSYRIGIVEKKENYIDEIVKNSGYLIIIFISLFIFGVPRESLLTYMILTIGVFLISTSVITVLAILHLMNFVKVKRGNLEITTLNTFGTNFILILSAFLTSLAVSYSVNLPLSLPFLIIAAAIFFICKKKKRNRTHYHIATVYFLLLSFIHGSLLFIQAHFLLNFTNNMELSFKFYNLLQNLHSIFIYNSNSPFIYISITFLILGIIDHFYLINKFKSYDK